MFLSEAFGLYGRPRLNLERDGKRVTSLADAYKGSFSPDGRYVLALGENARIWDWRHREVVAELPTDSVLQSAAFVGPDVVATLDGHDLRLWDWHTSQIISQLPTIDSDPHAIHSSAGQRIVVEGVDSTFVYRCEVCIPVSALRQLSDLRFPNPLTREQRLRYLHQP
jgi:WD40 repeat protein